MSIRICGNCACMFEDHERYAPCDRCGAYPARPAWDAAKTVWAAVKPELPMLAGFVAFIAVLIFLMGIPQ